MQIYKRKLPFLLLLIGFSLFFSSMTFTKPIQGQDTSTPCVNDEPYIVMNGELEVQQLYSGDILKGIFRADEFNRSEFELNPSFYTTSGPYNYAQEAIQINYNKVMNINSTLNGIHVVVVIENMDGVWNAFDNYCVQWADNVSNYCQNPIDFIVKDGWIEIPPLGSEVEIDDIELLGIFLLNDFNQTLFDYDPQQYLDNNTHLNYKDSAIMKQGGIEITDPLLEGEHLVIVFRDHSPNSQGDYIMAEKGFCDDRPPFETITYSVREGDILEYSVNVGGVDSPIPFFDTVTDNGSGFNVSDGDHLKVEFLEIPIWDGSQATDTTSSTNAKLKIVQEEDEEPIQSHDNPLETYVRIENGDQIVSRTQGFGWAIPLEIADLALNDPDTYLKIFNNDPKVGTAQTGSSNDTNNDFNPFANIISKTDTTVTLGGEFMDEENATVTMEITYNAKTGIATRMEFKRTHEQSPDITLIIDLTSDLAEYEDRVDNLNQEDNQTITTTPGYEALFLFIGLIGIIYVKKRRN